MKSFREFIGEAMSPDRMLKIAMANVMKYSDLNMAKKSSMEQGKYRTKVLMGDDGRYWVPATPREERVLVKAGYERVESE